MVPTFKAHKFRIYPTPAQQQVLAQFFGAKRWIFNHFLALNKEKFRLGEKHLGNFDINKAITQLKKEEATSWLRDIDDWCLKHASEDLHTAYSNFFNSVKGKRKGPKVEIPSFKSRNSQQSYRTRGIQIVDGKLKLRKIKSPIKLVQHHELTGTIKSATITKTPSGKYFVSILTTAEPALLPHNSREVGIDLGLKDLVITSDGVKFAHPSDNPAFARAKHQLKCAQRRHSRSKKGSKNGEKLRIKVARKYERVTNIHRWYTHNISHYLATNYGAIYTESLNVKGMMANHKLARKIGESAWSELVTQLNYKCLRSGATFVQIDRFYPSSKTCNSCGHKNTELKLSDREWTCAECGTEHDRDLNAARNVLHQGQRDVYGQVICTAETAGMGEIPMSLQKFTTKIERSGFVYPVGDGSKKAAEPLVQ